jgi:hypothetical protein
MTVRLLLLLALAFGATAQTTTPVLIPVFYNGPGAFGSQWFTSVAVNNFSSQTIEGRGLTFTDRSCAIPEGCGREELGPGDFGHVGDMFHPDQQWPAGFLLYLPANEADAVELDGRFGETTRNRYGVELPIAREDDFVRKPIVLPYVALTGSTNDIRTTLRVYSPDAIAGQQVRVELRPWGSRPTSPPQASVVLPLTIFDPAGTPEPLQPAYAQVDLQRAFPTIFSGAISMRIVPLQVFGNAVPRIWAFATAVRNDTNEVAVYSPR